jgi:hypothetical protein
MKKKKADGGRSRAEQYHDSYVDHDLANKVRSHTGEPGLRITWNFWRNDEYTDRLPIFCEICGHIVKIFGDQHGTTGLLVAVWIRIRITIAPGDLI